MCGSPHDSSLPLMRLGWATSQPIAPPPHRGRCRRGTCPSETALWSPRSPSEPSLTATASGRDPPGVNPPSRSLFVARVRTITTRRRNWPAPSVPPIGLVRLVLGRRSGLPFVHDRHGQPARVVAVIRGERDDVVVEQPRPGIVGREDKVAALPGPRLRCTPYPASSLAPPPRGGATASHRPRARRLLPTGFPGRIPRSPSLVDG